MTQRPHKQMAPRKQYFLRDFTRCATQRLAEDFAAISDMDLYQFAEKVYLNDRQNACRCYMLLVGHYSFKSGGPPVWAHATGIYIRYYKGAGNQVSPLIGDIHTSKVYYDPPFSFMGGLQNSGDSKSGINTERKLERAVVESAINFLFLSTGRLDHALDMDHPDMLANFKLAVKNFVRHQKANRTAHRALQEQPSDNRMDLATVREKTQPCGVYRGTLELAHRDRKPNSAVPAKRTFVDIEDDVSDVVPQSSNKRARLLEPANYHEAATRSELERELRDLNAKLAESETKNNATEARLNTEKTKRREARVQRKAWKDKYNKQQELFDAEAAKAAEDVKQEENIEDWKERLFEQERRTEEYKVKYIAMKEEKKKLDVQVKTLQVEAVNQKHIVTKLQCKALERKLEDAEKDEELEKQAEELGKEKETRIFWQRKHNSLSTRLRSFAELADDPTGPEHQAPGTSIVVKPCKHTPKKDTPSKNIPNKATTDKNTPNRNTPNTSKSLTIARR